MAAEWIADGLIAYAVFGAAFACAFVLRRVERGGLSFRLIIMPASAALWPLLLWKWVRGS